MALATASEGGLTGADHALARRIGELDGGYRHWGERLAACYARRVALMPDDEPSRSSGAPPRRSRSRA
jgi:hypothetical protein